MPVLQRRARAPTWPAPDPQDQDHLLDRSFLVSLADRTFALSVGALAGSFNMEDFVVPPPRCDQF